jgi:frataxin-like iron-binding protein CyaY
MKRTHHLAPEHHEKLEQLMPKILDSIHETLRREDVAAEVQTISFRPRAAVAAAAGGGCHFDPITGEWVCDA